MVKLSEKHALVVGGTGMLSEVSLWLMEMGYQTSVIGRSKEKHDRLMKKATHSDLMNSLKVDYHNHSLLEEQIRKSIQKYGPISLVVSWTPSTQALEIVNKLVSEYIKHWHLYQVKGSRRYFNDDILNVPSNCTQSSIYLGFILEGNHSRWLTHEEISAGVIQHIQSGNSESLIGRIHPYEKRPN